MGRQLYGVVFMLATLLAGCGARQDDNEIVVQRFFGTCRAEYGQRTDVENANGECGIITTLINQFAKAHPELRIRVSPVAWPGYNQLSAQLAAGDPPDVLVMHMSAISDYQSRGLLEPLDEGLKAVGVDPAGFTAVSRKGVTKEGAIYGLPFDTWAQLWHINLNYFRKAGLVDQNDEPILPTSPDELLAQARRFKQATGKPYFVQSLVNERGSYVRNLYTLLMQQNSAFFADPKHLVLQTPEARNVLQLMKTISAERLTTLNQDYAAATNGFMSGDGGVYLVGTWLIGDFDAESKKPGRPLSNGYTVRPYPKLFARDTTYTDGHAWVVPTKKRTETQRRAIYSLLKFLADNDYQWARTGHLPAYTAVIESEVFKSLPHRASIAQLGTLGSSLPPGVQRQFPIQDMLSEEVAAAIAGQKPIDQALADAEARINDLLFHLL